MKKKIDLRTALIPLVITVSCYLVFYSSIASKPSQVGFWLILAMGMALGIFLTHLFRGSKTVGKDDK